MQLLTPEKTKRCTVNLSNHRLLCSSAGNSVYILPSMLMFNIDLCYDKTILGGYGDEKQANKEG